MRKAQGQGVCVQQPSLAVLPENESILVPSWPCRTSSHTAGTLCLWGSVSRGSCMELQRKHRCTWGVCVHAKNKWKTEPALHLQSLQVFWVSWQRQMQRDVRKYWKVPAHLATGQHKGYGHLLTLQSNGPLLLAMPGMAVSLPQRKPGCSCKAKPWVANSHAQSSLTNK